MPPGRVYAAMLVAESSLPLYDAGGFLVANLTFNIDLAWSENGRPNPLTARLMGLLMVVIVYVGLIALLLSSATLGVLSMLPVALVRWLGRVRSPAMAMATPEMAAALAIVDPWSYRERLTMPKLIVNSAGAIYDEALRVNASDLPWKWNPACVSSSSLSVGRATPAKSSVNPAWYGRPKSMPE